MVRLEPRMSAGPVGSDSSLIQKWDSKSKGNFSYCVWWLHSRQTTKAGQSADRLFDVYYEVALPALLLKSDDRDASRYFYSSFFGKQSFVAAADGSIFIKWTLSSSVVDNSIWSIVTFERNSIGTKIFLYALWLLISYCELLVINLCRFD